MYVHICKIMGKYVYIKSWAMFSISVCLDLAEVE